MGGKISDLRAKLLAASGIDFRSKETAEKEAADQKELSANLMNELSQNLVEFSELLVGGDDELNPKIFNIIEGFRMIGDAHSRILVRSNHQFTRDLVVELLDALDNMEKVFKNYKNEENQEIINLLDGFKIVARKISKTLESGGVTKIQSLGLKFNPAVHHAVAQLKNDEVDDQTVIEEVSAGYTLNGIVVKPAVVIVSQKVEKKGRFRLWKK